jgi:hypothetical protein
MQDPTNPAVGDRVQHIENLQYGDVLQIDPVSAQTLGDQIILVKYRNETSVNARASEFRLITRKKDRTFGPPRPSGKNAWMA